MSSEPESPTQVPAPPPALSNDQALINAVFAAPEEPTKTDLSAATLERALRHESGQRKTERFFWILGLMLLLDAGIGRDSLGLVAALAPLQILMLLGLAHWLDVEFVKKPLEHCFDRLWGKKDP